MRRFLASVALLIVGITLAAQVGRGQEKKPADAWVKSNDGKLALRLRIKETKIQPTGAVELHATLKNVSDKTIHVVTPFGDWRRAVAAHLNIRGPLGMLMYAEPTPSYSYVIGTAAFVHVKPGESIEHPITLTLDEYIGFDLPGVYSIHYESPYGGEWNQTHKLTPAPWEGKIRSQPVKIEILKTENDVWTMSNDKVVGLQLSGDVDPGGKTQPVVLKATIRNFSSKPVAVLKPLGGPFTGMPEGLDVRGPKGVVKYTGPAVQARPWAGTDFVSLFPGQKHEIHFELDPKRFAGGDTPGKYTIEFDYETKSCQAIAKDLGIARYWSGRLPRVTFVYDHPKDAKRELPLPNEVLNAGRNPKDPRILALVAYLDKNGVKLVLGGDHYWHITKPAAPGSPDGAFAVSIRTFPEDTSEMQMRMALHGVGRAPARIALPYKLNAPARIAMSYVSGHGPTKATMEDFAAVEKKLAHLFKEYRPAAPKDAVDEIRLIPPGKSEWMIRFRPDGSVGAQWSRCDYPGGDTAKLPKGSVDFDSLLKAAYRLKSDKRQERLSTISVLFKDETNTVFSLNDDTLFRYLIDSLDKKWQSDLGGTRFDELRRKYPIYNEQEIPNASGMKARFRFLVDEQQLCV